MSTTVGVEIKRCTRCKEDLGHWEFSRDSRVRSGLASWCRSCDKEYRKEYNKKNAERFREYSYREAYGLTLEDYSKMLAAQGGKCAICEQTETATQHGKVKQLSVDHNHKTGQVRDLLCRDCNWAFGHFKENPEVLRQAADYAEKWAQTESS